MSQPQNSIEEEIEELERDACDEINVNKEVRYMYALKATMLRHGYRLIALPKNARVVQAIHIASGRIVDRISADALAWAPIGVEGWLAHIQQCHRILESQGED